MFSKVAGILEMNGRVSSTLKKCLLQVYSIPPQCRVLPQCKAHREPNTPLEWAKACLPLLLNAATFISSKWQQFSLPSFLWMITSLSRLTAVTKGSCWSTLFPRTHTMAQGEKKHQISCVQDRLKVFIAWTEVKNWLLYQEPVIPKGRVSTCLAKAGGDALSLGAQNWASS